MAKLEELTTDAELCKRLRISLPTLRKYVDTKFKDITRFEVGKSRRWLTVSVDKFIAGQ